MARGGQYKSDVQKARDSLRAQGKHPSLDAVRIALGNTGSKTTIHRYLKELEAEEGAGLGGKVAVSDALQDLVARLAERLHGEAETLVAEAKARSDAQLATQAEALARKAQEAAGYSEQLQRTEVALAEERSAHGAAQAALQDQRVVVSQLEERIAGLTARLAEQEGHVASLEQKHAQAREALEHFRTAAKEQRDQELRRHEHQVQGLQLELRQAHESLSGKNHELVQLNGSAARLTEQVGGLQKELQQSQAEARRKDDALAALETVREELQALKARWIQSEQATNTAQAQLQDTLTTLAQERQARGDAEIRAATAEAGRVALEQLFTRFERLADAPAKSSAD